MERLTATRVTASGLIHTGQAVLFGVLAGTDGVNDPVVTIYNDTGGSTAANRIVPPTTIDASLLGFNGFMNTNGILATTGLYITISDLGTGEIHVYWRPR